MISKLHAVVKPVGASLVFAKDVIQAKEVVETLRKLKFKPVRFVMKKKVGFLWGHISRIPCHFAYAMSYRTKAYELPHKREIVSGACF